MSTQDSGHRDEAIGALARRAYIEAGDEYTRAGRAVLADPRPGIDPFDPGNQGWVGIGLQHLLVAALSYRAGRDPETARFRGVETAAVAGELAQRVSDSAQSACFEEFRADCRVAGGLSGIADGYDDAIDAYEAAANEVEDPAQVSTTPLFQAAAAPLKQVARGFANGEIAIEWSDLHGANPADPGQFLASTANYKRQRFPTLVDRLVTEEHLAAPRGTTEYATDHHRCPHCDSTDVNWVGDQTLCLRCSQRTEPV